MKPYGHVPEAFRGVDLGDRHTWHRATFREWLDLRSHLQEKAGRQGDPWEWADRWNKAMMAASNRLSKEMGIYSKKWRPPKGGDVGRRREELFKEEFYDKYPEYDPITEWEDRFLKATQCFDEILADYRQHGRRSNIGMLTDWLVGIEDEEELAQARAAERELDLAAVATLSDRRRKSRRNPFYPRPLELIRIDLALTIVVANIERDFRTFVSMGGPVPGTEPERTFRVREFFRTNNPYQSVVRFIGDLKRLGYSPYRQEQEVIEWEDWPMVLDYPGRAAARELLAFLFFISKDTIRKDLSRKRLQELYKQYKIARGPRIYIHKNKIPQSVTLLRSGWFSRVENGYANRYDDGTTYYLKPDWPLPEHPDSDSGI